MTKTRVMLTLLLITILSTGCEAQRTAAQADLVRAETEQTEIDSLQDAQQTLAELLLLSMTQTEIARSEAVQERDRAIHDQQEIITQLLKMQRAKEQRQTAAIVVVALILLLGSLAAAVFLLMRRQQEKQRQLQLMMLRFLALHQGPNDPGMSIQLVGQAEVLEPCDFV